MTFFKSRNLAVIVRLKTEISASCNCGHFCLICGLIKLVPE